MRWLTYFFRKTSTNLWREPLLNGATVLTLAVAFLCFCAFLLVATGLGGLVDRWAEDFHISVYLAEEVGDEDAGQIAATLEELAQVQRATVVTADQMRARLVEEMGDDHALAGLDGRLFPTTIELRLSDEVRDPELIGALAERLRALAVVDQVETYGDLFTRLRSVSVVARAVTIILGVIVLLATLLVVSNTVRLSLLGRREEIEIMKLCGATDRFVRAPFLINGALQGLVGSLLSLGLLAVAGGVLNRAIGGLVPALWSDEVMGLPLFMSLAIVVGGTALGLAGSHLSVSRFLQEAP